MPEGESARAPHADGGGPRQGEGGHRRARAGCPAGGHVTCVGFWNTRSRHVVAVAVDDDGNPGPPLRAAHTDEACCALLAYLEATDGLDFELVVPDWLARSTPTARAALKP